MYGLSWDRAGSNVVGCIDDKHISTIIAPSENETNYCMNGRMPDGGVVQAVTTSTAVK